MVKFLKNEIKSGWRQRIFGLLTFLIFVLIFLYCYFINLTILKTAEYKKEQTRIAQLKSEIQNLETNYIKNLNKLTISYAKEMGFVESEPAAFITLSKTMAQNVNYGQFFR